MLLVGVAATGAFLAGRSSNDAVPTASSLAPPHTETTGDDPSDGVLSAAEYLTAQSMLRSGGASPMMSNLERETMQSMADDMCSIALTAVSGTEVRESFKALIRGNGSPLSEVDLDEGANVAAVAAIFVCLDDLPT